MHEAVPPLPNTPSWCGAQLKKAQGKLNLYPIRNIMGICKLNILIFY
jgi:hypothetical protein